VADDWCWFVLREKYCWLVAGGWFVVIEKYCWLVADKPSEQGECFYENRERGISISIDNENPPPCHLSLSVDPICHEPTKLLVDDQSKQTLNKTACACSCSTSI
jgi:hypothetical protein